MVLAAALPPLPPVCVVPTGVARLAAAATVMAPLVPDTVLFDELAMFGLHPPAASTVTGVARAATHIAMVNSAIHLFIRIVLSRYGDNPGGEPEAHRQGLDFYTTPAIAK
jgi:hypothetical protein